MSVPDFIGGMVVLLYRLALTLYRKRRRRVSTAAIRMRYLRSLMWFTFGAVGVAAGFEVNRSLLGGLALLGLGFALTSVVVARRADGTLARPVDRATR